MILKYLILFSVISITITSSDPFFGTDTLLNPAPKEDLSDVRVLPWMKTEAFRPYLLDSQNRVSDLFPVTDYFYPTVQFWFLVYTQFSSNTVVIHDKNNLSLIYKVLDFSSLAAKNLSRNTRFVLQQKISGEMVDALRADLGVLVSNPFSLSPASKEIYRLIKQAGITLPLKKHERVSFFQRLKGNLRTQTGQRDFIRDGIARSLPYQHFLSNYFKSKSLPKELLAIPFLESSFNPKAQSKVSALGIWQFMPLISSYYVPKRTKDFDYRFNVGVASVAAAFLLSENQTILKSWDLTVTAYNSGTKHLLKTKRELASPKISLERIIKHSDSQHFGFASKNFYSEFLALAHTLAYKEELFNDLHEHERNDVNKDLKFYISKCPLHLKKALDDNQLDDIFFHNHHTSEANHQVPKGFILISKSALPKTIFFEIPSRDLLKKKPKEWSGLVARQSCSTR